MEKISLHIISFNVPFPANYGGVIDVFYKIKTLHQLGINIILHTFQYGREPADELQKYCSKVFYYPRPTDVLKQFSSLPFIVKTRNAKALLQKLKKDDYPILFEGLHTCYFLNHVDLKKRKKFIRMHNVEWQYYAHLAKMESNFFKKNYFKIESKKLLKFEKSIRSVDAFFAISKGDANYFGKKYSDIPTHFIPAFHPNEKLDIQSGRGEYILFHGDLSVKDNEEAVIFLLKNITEYIDYQWIIAGLNPSENLIHLISQTKNVKLEANVSHQRMEDLIKNAHVNILLSFQSAGMKLKLLNALFRGRFCVVNNFMVEKTGMENLCKVGNEPSELIEILNDILSIEFSENEIKKRKEQLGDKFSNEKSGKDLKRILAAYLL